MVPGKQYHFLVLGDVAGNYQAVGINLPLVTDNLLARKLEANVTFPI
jgi:hypothetical protein